MHIVLIINKIMAVTFAWKQSNVTAYLPAPTGKLTVGDGMSEVASGTPRRGRSS